MRPVTRLRPADNCFYSQCASALTPVCHGWQIGVFFEWVYMFLYKLICVLVALVALVSANAEEGVTTDARGDLVSTAAGSEREGERLRMNPVDSYLRDPSRAASRDEHHASQFAPGRIASTEARDKGHGSVNAIGARRGNAAARIEQRENHRFYIVWQQLSDNDDEKTTSVNYASQVIDVERRLAQAPSVGNLRVDPSLLLKSAGSSRGEQR